MVPSFRKVCNVPIIAMQCYPTPYINGEEISYETPPSLTVNNRRVLDVVAIRCDGNFNCNPLSYISESQPVATKEARSPQRLPKSVERDPAQLLVGREQKSDQCFELG